jgi:MFS superfamily sulfate permease-like transporter
VKHSTYPKISVLGRVVDDAATNADGGLKYKYRPLQEIHSMPDRHVSQDDREILVVRVEESLFFANTGQMKDRLRRAEAYEGLLHIHPSEDERREMRAVSQSEEDQANSVLDTTASNIHVGVEEYHADSHWDGIQRRLYFSRVVKYMVFNRNRVAGQTR